ncbi:MAG: polymerase sigma-70 factor, subfamily [Pseudonocardiales bacterium]|jgi:RNA polymerase sigma-70 factor (ECF subfamily)|nr:polymerase sigma-70 factor, subfamily [Pseudonocardiales bacterium]
MEQLLTADEVMSNAGLVTRVRDTAATGVDDALTTLYADHRRALLAYAERFTNDRGRAEDVVQETFLRAWRRLPGLLEDDRSVRAWLFLVTRRLLVDSARAESTRPALADEEPTIEGIVDGGFDRLLDHTILVEAMQRLSEPHQQILVETFFAGHPVHVAAARLGVPPGTARSRLHYAISQLRRQLDPRIVA